MKKKLMMILLLCATLVPVAAQTEKSHILIYKLDSTVDTLLLSNVRQVYHSRMDKQGNIQPDVSTLRVRTLDGELVYPLTEIDHLVMPKSARVISFMGTSQGNDDGDSNAPRRTSIDFSGGQTYNYQWVSGDYIYLSTGDRSRNVEYPYGSLSSKTTKGEFTFASDSLVADEYIVYYSGTNRGTNDNPIPYNKVMIPTTQTQKLPNNSDHLGANGDCGIATAIRQKNSNYQFKLAHKTAIICFMPRVEAYEGTLLETLRLKHVAVKADQNIAGTYTLSPDGLSTMPDASTGSDTITLLTNDFNLPIPHQKTTAQDSVASYMVVAPQTGKTTSFKVYYRVYDIQSELDTIIEKKVSINNIKGAMVYPVTHKIDPHILFAAQTDSVKWKFGEDATLYGSVNLPLKADSYTGFIWGYNQNLTFDTKQADIHPVTLNAQRSFNSVIGQNVRQTAYYYRAYAYEDVEDGVKKYYFGKVKKFGMDRDIINMGTSVRWSSINMGAITKEDAGDFYAWGELQPKETFSQANYQYYQDNAYTNIGSNIAGEPAYDPVTALWRGCWRMPTKNELHELATKCDWSWDEMQDEDGNMHRGLLVKNRNNVADSVIFLPAAGYRHAQTNYADHCYYLSGTEHDTGRAKYQYDSEQNMNRASQRWEGLSIRPVFDSNIETPTGEYLFISTDGFVYNDNQTEATLYGTLRGLDDVVTDITQGFVIGTTADVTLTSGETILKKDYHQPAADNGTYHILFDHATMESVGLGNSAYIRAYLTYKDHTYYGGSVQMKPMELTTDSTNWQVNMTSARLCGTALGISESIKDIVELGFVVGTTDNVTLETAGKIALVSDSTGNGKFVAVLDNIELKQYYYRAYLRHKVTGQVFYGDPKMLGLEFVDLGLPSGLKWANINVGSQTPMDNGNYYAWGEVTTKSNYRTNEYTVLNESDIAGTIHDAAQVNWQGPWRMPTKADVQELINNCTAERTTLYDKSGFKLTSKINGKTIFMPFTGYYNGTSWTNSNDRLISWTSTKSTYSTNKNNDAAYFIDDYNHVAQPLINSAITYQGLTIRPVALVNNTLDDESKIQLTTDSVTWEVGQTSATLHGYLLGLRYNRDATESGFAYSNDHISDNADGSTPGVSFLKTSEGEIFLVASGNYQCILSGVEDGKVYYYRAYVKVGDKYYYANEREFGRRMVKLFNDSDILWSNINLGASSPDDSGDFYAWGETAPKSSYTKSNYTYTGTMENISGSQYDAVHVAEHWRGIWRMPTKTDLEELLDRCTWTEVTKYGQPMYKVVGETGDSIFIAKSGSMSGTSHSGQNSKVHIWTSNLNTTANVENDNAYASNFNGSSRVIAPNTSRYLGYAIRPIAKYNAEFGDTKFYLSTDSTNWQVGNANPRLVGSVTGLDALGEGATVTRGFLVTFDKTPETTLKALADGGNSQKVTEVVATASNTDDSFRGTIVYAKDTTYFYRAYVKIEKAGEPDAYYYGNIRRYGLELVDMGNGVKWATLNVGAQISSDYGDRYAWGEKTVKSYYYEDTYTYYSNGYENIGSDISGSSRDVAHIKWDGTWRMPTNAEMNWLVENCTWTWGSVDGQPGYTVTSNVEGYEDKQIFLPAAGYQSKSFYEQINTGCYYWTSAVDAANGFSKDLYGTSTQQKTDKMERYLGLSVRPVTTAGSDEGGGGDISGGHNQGGSQQTGGEGGEGSGGAGTGDTGGVIGN